MKLLGRLSNVVVKNDLERVRNKVSGMRSVGRRKGEKLLACSPMWMSDEKRKHPDPTYHRKSE